MRQMPAGALSHTVARTNRFVLLAYPSIACILAPRCLSPWREVLKPFALLALCLPLLGQTNSAVLHGSIHDPQNQPVRNASVSVIAAETGAHRTTLTDDAGWYEVVGLAPGEYRIEVAATGFTPSNTLVKLEVGQQMGL